jgi:hypothetical protein
MDDHTTSSLFTSHHKPVQFSEVPIRSPVKIERRQVAHRQPNYWRTLLKLVKFTTCNMTVINKL